MANIKIKNISDIAKVKDNFVGHTKTILKHKKEVMKNCFRCGLFVQGITHDLSKFSPTEFIPGVLHYQGTRSPNEGEREDYGYSKAWMHHKGRNRHHFEYWTDYDRVTRQLTPVPMPKRYVIEMFCDRVAASKTYLGKNYTDRSALEYYLNGKPARNIAPQTAADIEKLLHMLEKKGEKKTFSYIRKAVFLHRPL